MKNHIDDPMWTAYALGELTPPQLREAEALLAADPLLRQQVDLLKDTLALLQENFEHQPEISFDPLRRESVLQTAANFRPAPPSWVWIPSAAAAMLAIGLGVAHFLSVPPVQTESKSDTLRGEDLAPMEIMMDSKEALPSPALEMAESPAKEKIMEPTREQRPRSTSSASAPSLQKSVDDFSAGCLESNIERDELKEEALPLPTPTPTPTPEPEKTMERGF